MARGAFPRGGVRARLPVMLRRLAVDEFDPTDIPGLALWLDGSDASTVTLDGSGNVEQWNDKSGNGRHATQTTANNRPAYSGTQNGRKVVTFDGSNDHLAGSAVFSATPCTFLAVVNFTADKQLGVVFEQYTGTTDSVALYRGHSSTNGFRMFNGVDLTSNAFIANNRWTVIGFEAGTTSSSSKLFYNGTVDKTGNAGTTTPASGGYYLARWAGAGASPFGAYTPMIMAELVAFSTSLATADRSKVEAYLSKKWGVTF